MNKTADLTELWEQTIAEDENAGASDREPPTIWERHAVVKITPKRIYTEPYRELRPFVCDGWTHREVRPYFDRETLERDGFAWHRSMGGSCLMLYLVRGSDDRTDDI